MEVENKNVPKDDYFGNLPTPWIDEKGNTKIYWKRHTDVLILLVVYFFIISMLYFVMFARYKQTGKFWTIFFVSVVLSLFGALCIWYENLHQNDIFISCFIALVFVIIFALFVFVTLESHHQSIVYIKIK